ncbi:MAG: Hsp20/alpha crystallin family protein [Planctomycetaceae bacterium]|nr:Hsp20/alpha crystallin family protein [Planctomycetaceae bacterium]
MAPDLWEYPADIAEEPNKIVVDAELPGYTDEEVQVDYSRGILTIRAHHKDESSPERGQKFLSERQMAPMERSFVLPAEVDQANMGKTLENGVLHLELPKAPETTKTPRRRIEISSRPRRVRPKDLEENGRGGRSRSGTGRHAGGSGRRPQEEAE